MSLDSGWSPLRKNLTASQVLARLLTADGAGSGLDADLLDGYNSSSSATASTIALRDASGELAVATPTADGNAATKGYVDGLIEGLTGKGLVRAVATGNIDLGTAADPGAIDGVTLSNGDLVLLSNQTDSSENGSWTAVTAADPTTWTRPDNFAAGSGASMAIWLVDEGTTYSDTRWWCTSNDGSDVVDTNDLAIERFSGAAEITAGDGLTKTGNSIAVDADVLRDADVGSQVQAYDAGLASIAGLTTAADKMIYTTALDTYAVADLSSFARTLLDDTDASTARTTLGLGSLATASTISNSDWSGADLAIENGGTGSSSASAARTALGLAIGSDVLAYDANVAAIDQGLATTDSVAFAGISLTGDIDTGNNNIDVGTGKIITTLENVFIETSDERAALSTSRFGYTNPQYKVLKIGNSSTTSADYLTLSFGVDTEDVTGGTFTGDGREIVIRRNASFITPNAGGTNWQKVFNLDNDVIEFSIPLDTQGNNIELGGGSITSDTGTINVSDTLDLNNNPLHTGGYIEIGADGSGGYIGLGDGNAGSFIDILGELNLQDKLSLNNENIEIGTTTGTKIGTAADQKIGIWNATPVVQPSHIADASASHTITDPGDAPADADALRDDLVTNTIPSIESALDALGTKINTILANVLETTGLTASS